MSFLDIVASGIQHLSFSACSNSDGNISFPINDSVSTLRSFSYDLVSGLFPRTRTRSLFCHHGSLLLFPLSASALRQFVSLRRLGRSPSNFDHLNHVSLDNSGLAWSSNNATTFEVGREQCSAQYVYNLFMVTKSVLISIHSQLWIVTFLFTGILREHVLQRRRTRYVRD